MALRPALLLNISSAEDDTSQEKAAQDKDKDTDFGVEVALEKYMNSGKPVAPYIGGKAGIALENNKVEAGDTETETKNTSFEIAALAGFQWGFTEGLTLGGEYTLGVEIGKHKVEFTDGNTTTTTADNSFTRIGIGTASLFLSVAM
jgi:opacity protein-like surface antigen